MSAPLTDRDGRVIYPAGYLEQVQALAAGVRAAVSEGYEFADLMILPGTCDKCSKSRAVLRTRYDGPTTTASPVDAYSPVDSCLSCSGLETIR